MSTTATQYLGGKLLVQHDGWIEVTSAVGGRRKMPAVKDGLGRRYALLSDGQQLFAWDGDPMNSNVPCELFR